MRRGLVSRVVFPFLAVGLLLTAPCVVLAIPFDIEVFSIGSSGSARVTIPELNYTGGVRTDYTLNTDIGSLDAFCVQADWAPAQWQLPQTYYLQAVPENLYAAAWVAELYWSGGYDPSLTKADFQVAIWDLVIDGFVYHSGDGGNYGTVLGSVSEIVGAPSMVAWAANETFQDHLVRHPVSEPSTMLLLGFGLLGLAGFGRKTLRG